MKRNSVPDHSIFQKSYGYSIFHNFIACYFFCLPKECPRPWHSIEKKYITYLIVHNEKKMISSSINLLYVKSGTIYVNIHCLSPNHSPQPIDIPRIYLPILIESKSLLWWYIIRFSIECF